MTNRFRAALFSLIFALLYSTHLFAQAVQIPPGEQCFQATSGINGMIGLLGTITSGSGGTNGTYVNVALTGGSGTTATANITVSGGVVTAVQILSPGVNYAVADVLSASSGNIGGVTGFSVPVASISINSAVAGGFVGMYQPGTLTTKTTWKDAGQTILNSNPISLDSNGCAVIYGIGTYRQIVYDSLGNVVWDKNTSVPNVASFAVTSAGTANAQTVTASNFNVGDGQQIIFRAILANTGAMTLQPNGGSLIPVYRDNPTPVPLTGGEISLGSIVTVTYDAVMSVFHLTNVDNTALLTANNTFSGNNSFTGNNTHSGTETFNGATTFNRQANFTDPVTYLEQALTYVASGNTAFDPTTGPNATLTLTGTTTNLSAITGQSGMVGATGYIRFTEDATGGRLITFDSTYAAADGGPIFVSQIANVTTAYTYIVRGASGAGSVILVPWNVSTSPVLLNTITISNVASVSDTTSFLTGFRYYEIDFENVVPATNNVGFTLNPQVSATFQTTVVSDGVASDPNFNSNSPLSNGFNSTSGSLIANIGNLAGGGINGSLKVYNPASTTTYKNFIGQLGAPFSNNTQSESYGPHAYYQGSQAAVTGFRVQFTSGNLSTGVVRVYGHN